MSGEKKSFHKDDAILLLNKGKRSLLQVLFGRTMIIIALLLIQIFLLYGFFFRLLGDYLAWYVAASSALAAIMSGVVVNSHQQNPTVKLTWIVLIFIVPIFAIPLYFFVNMDVGHRLSHALIKRIREKTRSLSKQDEETLAKLPEESQGLANYMWQQGDYPVCHNSTAQYFPIGEKAFDEMLWQLEKAEEFIFLEYFIVDEGYMWGRILKILEEKARDGVEVRLLYDGTCSVARLPHSYPKKLEELGIRCRLFAPLRPFVSTHYNNRDHRKIMVIDGKVAFTGGINLSDEYINRVERHGHWKDTAIMVEGEAVRSFTLMFLQMWSSTEIREPLEGEYLPYLNSPAVMGDGIYIPYGSCPHDEDKVAEMVYIDMINRARRYVHIMTPYLILDNEMVTALTFAARRGVDVTVIMPHIPDKKAIFAVSRSYYRQFLEAGIRIFEYTPGFVHAKSLVSDDVRAVVGTINFDYRSLYHHFECGLYLENAPAVEQVETDFQSTLQKSQRITPSGWKRQQKLVSRLTGWVLRLFAPLL